MDTHREIESYKFKKGAMIRIYTNTIRFNKDDIK